jgi:hypothetical protein
MKKQIKVNFRKYASLFIIQFFKIKKFKVYLKQKHLLGENLNQNCYSKGYYFCTGRLLKVGIFFPIIVK